MLIFLLFAYIFILQKKKRGCVGVLLRDFSLFIKYFYVKIHTHNYEHITTILVTRVHINQYIEEFTHTHKTFINLFLFFRYSINLLDYLWTVWIITNYFIVLNTSLSCIVYVRINVFIILWVYVYLYMSV